MLTRIHTEQLAKKIPFPYQGTSIHIAIPVASQNKPSLRVHQPPTTTPQKRGERI